MTTDCKLYVNGQVFSGWTALTVRQSLSSVAGAFTVAFTDRWSGQSTTWVIAPGAKCRLELEGATVVTGYVDTLNVAHAAGSHTLTVGGRDATGDLVDCSAENATYLNQPFTAVCSSLVQPFGISVVDQVGSDYTIKRFVVQTGESVFQALERASRLAGVLLTSDGEGRLILARSGSAGRASTALETGVNVLSASLTQDASQLYSVVQVKSQCTASGLNQYDLSVAAPEARVGRVQGSSTIPGVDRYRPLTLVAETQATTERCQRRAAWEAGRRQALSKRVDVTVQGWTHDDGSLWKPNQLVHLKDSILGIDEDWLIETVNFSLSAAGTTTRLQLVGPGAYEVLPSIPEPTFNKFAL